VNAASPDELRRSDVARLSPRLDGRDPALDLLRSVALVRVILWHAFAASWMMAIAAMPVMFFVAGSLLPAAAPLRSTVTTVVRRSKRILIPLWLYAATVAVVLLGAGKRLHWDEVRSVLWWIVPLGDPPASDFHAGWLSNHLWYLRAYLWILLLSPLLVRAMRRRNTACATIAALGVGVVALDVVARLSWRVPLVSSGPSRIVIGDVIAYGLFAALGLLYGRARKSGDWAAVAGRRGTQVVLAGASCGFAIATIAFATISGLPKGGINASYPAIVLCGMAWLCGIAALEPWLRRFAQRASVARATQWISSRALTIYLWHPASIVVARVAVDGDGPLAWFGITLITFVLTALAVLGVGWVEDRAAARSARHRLGLSALLANPRHVSRATARGGFLLAVMVAMSTCMPTLVPIRVAASPGGTVGTTEAAVVARREILPPSFREALGDDAFAAPTEASTPPSRLPSATASATVVSTTIDPDADPVAAADAKVSDTAAAVDRAASDNAASDIAAWDIAASSTAESDTLGSDTAVSDTGASGGRVSSRAVELRVALDEWAAARPGLNSIAVVVADGDDRWMADIHQGRTAPAFGVNDVFPIASLTKTFTMALVLREVEKATIDLDAPVPPLDGIGDLNESLGITPRMLLSHASGLVNYTNADDFSARTLTPVDAVAMSLRTPLRSSPGTTVYYANTNYLYLGLLLEHVTGRPYRDLVAEMVASVGLSDSDVDVVRGKGWVGSSSGGMSSSLPDLARWIDGLYTPGKVLSERSIEMISTLSDLKIATGMWPICPCSTDPATGARRYTAIGHQAEFGAINEFPASGVSVVVRLDPPNEAAGAEAADLGRVLSAIIGAPAGPSTGPQKPATSGP
jgi:CubicO group peptidase (beta-lactamase class C family)/peptidoglycan/LPS O-acetylase OafA/YrhL